MTARVVDRFALWHWCAAVRFIVLEEGRARCVDLHLHRNAEFMSVFQHCPMGARQACWPKILVVARFPVHSLCGSISELDLRTGTCSPITSPGSRAHFEKGHIVAQLPQLVGCHQTADAATKDDYSHPLADTSRRLDRRYRLTLGRHQPKRLHRG